jgi:hypothetical protein
MMPTFLSGAATVFLLAAAASYAQTQSSDMKQGTQSQGQAIITVVPSNNSDEHPIRVSEQDIKEIKVAGKPSQVTGWTPLRNQPVELVLLIDNEAQVNFGNQLNDIKKFSQELPPNTRMGIAWMQNGGAVMESPLSSDPAEIGKGIRLPSGMAGANASPYFSLSALAKNWPSQNRRARRVVLMICDGIDDYNPRYDPNDPYVQTAMKDAIRSGLIVYSIFWPERGHLASFGWAQNAGQNLLTQLTEATGGKNFWQGFGDPVSIDTYLKDLRKRISNQYAIGFTGPAADKPSVERFDLKLSVPSAKVDSPQQVLVQPNPQAER